MRATSPRPDGFIARTISTLAAIATAPVSNWAASSCTYGSRRCRASHGRGAAVGGDGGSAWSSGTVPLPFLRVGNPLRRQVRRFLRVGDDHHPGLAPGRAAGRRSGVLALVLVLVLGHDGGLYDPGPAADRCLRDRGLLG